MIGLLIIVAIVIAIIRFVISYIKKNDRSETISSTRSSLEDSGFTASKQVTDTDNNYSILIDDIHHQWAIIEGRNAESTIYNYSDLVEYEILEDGERVVKGSVGSAVAGRGRRKKAKKVCHSLSVNIVVYNLSMPQIVIPLLSVETKIESKTYHLATSKAKEFAMILAIIKVKAEQDEAKEASVSDVQFHVSEEIEQLYELKEKGIITEEEFNNKKKKLLE